MKLAENQRRSTNVEDISDPLTIEYLLNMLTTPFVQGVMALQHPFEGPETIPLEAYKSQLSRDAGFWDIPESTGLLSRINQWGAK